MARFDALNKKLNLEEEGNIRASLLKYTCKDSSSQNFISRQW